MGSSSALRRFSAGRVCGVGARMVMCGFGAWDGAISLVVQRRKDLTRGRVMVCGWGGGRSEEGLSSRNSTREGGSFKRGGRRERRGQKGGSFKRGGGKGGLFREGGEKERGKRRGREGEKGERRRERGGGLFREGGEKGEKGALSRPTPPPSPSKVGWPQPVAIGAG